MKLNLLTENIPILISNQIENLVKEILEVKNISKTLNGEKKF